MKIKSLYCPCNERTDNPLDHYEREDCGAVPLGKPERVPLEWITAVLAQATSDKYHADGRLTATRILGCPRESVILDNKEIVYDVRSGNQTYHGTLLHRELERCARPGAYQEIVIPPFQLGDYFVEGRTDRVAGDFSVIKDWKSHSENSQRFKYEYFMKGERDPEGAAQLNIYRIGIAKSVLKVEPMEYRPKLVLVHGANVAFDGVPWFEAEQPVLSEEQILALRPFDDAKHPGTQPFTVRELMKQHVDATTRIKAGEPIDDVIKSMPMVGQNVWAWKWNKAARSHVRQAIGDKCLKYCVAAEACMGLHGIPFERAR